ncbi:proto-oncogene tyrosine-protein kinase receptor Ret-like isoform X1 [Oculina patagonica]
MILLSFSDETSANGLGSGNTNEIEDGHQTVSREAAQSLQVLGPAVEPNCANVDLSKRKKKNRKPPSDKNALVVISKKLKKTPKKNVKASAAEPDQSFSMLASGGSTNYAVAVPSSGNYMSFYPSGRRWEVNREQVNIIKVIGKGAFSQVAKATAWDIRGNGEYTTVAAKMLKANAPESDRKDLLSELELMKKLKPHPHVIKLMGCVTQADPLLVLIEYVPFGDLLGYLRKSRGLNDTYFKDPDVKPQTSLTAEQLMRFAWQVADGMFYLSSRKIIHRDLAARNVLVGEGEKCKVTDFGMARSVHQDDIYTKRSRGRLPAKWTAYEALLYGTYTTQSDVWSYGVLLYEILTVGGSPYPGIKAREIARKLQEGFRMPKPKHVDSKLYQIMLKCWEENPIDRPTFAKLKDTIKDMERNHRTYVNLKQYDNSLYANIEDLTAV